jgi:hypothetical protein
VKYTPFTGCEQLVKQLCLRGGVGCELGDASVREQYVDLADLGLDDGEQLLDVFEL